MFGFDPEDLEDLTNLKKAPSIWPLLLVLLVIIMGLGTSIYMLISTVWPVLVLIGK
jgi:hypothetical protein